VVFFHLFWGSKNFIIWFNLDALITEYFDLYYFGKVFKIKIQKSINKKKTRKKCKGCQLSKKYAPTKSTKKKWVSLLIWLFFYSSVHDPNHNQNLEWTLFKKNYLHFTISSEIFGFFFFYLNLYFSSAH
jgi:hypothetical protein